MNHLDLIRSILADHGYITTVATDHVRVELTRAITSMEVFYVLFDEELDNLCQVVGMNGYVKVFPLED
jgi:hypothetical protein